MAELLFLGTSAGIPTENRNNSGMAIKKDGSLYLIDCGGPVSSLLKKMGEDPKNIEAVFLTHWHPDHASGLPMLIQDLQLTRREQKLTIYGPHGTDRKVKQLQNIFILPPEIYPFELITKEYDEDTVYVNDQLKISFFKTKHLSQRYWMELDRKHANEINPVAFGLVVQVDGKKVVISGDLFSSDDLIPALPGADLVIHEFGHVTPDVLSRFVREQKIPNLLITHIHHEWDSRDTELKEKIALEYAGEVNVAQDLLRFAL